MQQFTQDLRWILRIAGVWNRTAAAITLVAAIAILGPGQPARSQGVGDLLQTRTQALSGEASAGGVPIAGVPFIQAFYALRAYRPAWTGTASGAQLFAAIADSPVHGLRPQDAEASQRKR